MYMTMSAILLLPTWGAVVLVSKLGICIKIQKENEKITWFTILYETRRPRQLGTKDFIISTGEYENNIVDRGSNQLHP